VLRPLSETCFYILVIDRNLPERQVLRMSVVAGGLFAISCNRLQMALEKARGKIHGRGNSLRNRLEQGCTDFGYQVGRANKIT
jgi:hypothetical protein